VLAGAAVWAVHPGNPGFRKGSAITTFSQTLTLVAGLLCLGKRVSYRRLRKEFGLDDETLEDVRHELIVMRLNLASCLLAVGDAAEALPLCRRALESREHVLGAEHPDTLMSVNNLAECLRALGDAAGALPHCHRALESSQHVLGPDHPQTLTYVNNLASCLQARGHASGALPLFRLALAGRERMFGAEHPDALASANNLARTTLACASGLVIGADDGKEERTRSSERLRKAPALFALVPAYQSTGFDSRVPRRLLLNHLGDLGSFGR
jgi:tetratricopeptide (TPR) repeat protein